MSGAPNLHPAEKKPFDASNPDQVKERERSAIRREKEHREVLVTLLSTPQGRNWMWEILDSCNVYAQSYAPGNPDVTVFNEGRRSVGNQILAGIMRASPDLVVTLIKEQGQA